MEEFWICQNCRSLNRASAGKCYRCKQKYGSGPKDAAPVVKNAGAVAPPRPALPPLADFSAAAPQQPSLSRPVALPPASFAGLAATRLAATGAPQRRARRGLPNPVSAVKGRIARSLAQRQFVSVSWLGYLTTILLLLLVVDGAILVLTVLPAATNLLQSASPATAWAHLTSDQQSLTRTLAIALGALGILSLLCFSIFLGLTTHNSTGLGADMPLLTPYGGGIIWPVAVWTQARIAVGLIVPAALIWLKYPIPGLIAALVTVEIAQGHLDDPLGWLSRPYRHLPDLYAKLGIEGSIESPMASLWSACFRAANVLAIVTYALPLLALVLVSVSTAVGRDNVPGWQSTGLGPTQLGAALVVGSLVAVTAGAVALLVPITIGLIRRQDTRKTLVRVGRSRSWAARPGQGGYTAGPAQPTALGYDDPLDRVVEHYPKYTSGAYPGLGPGGGQSSPGGGQGFGPDPGQGGGPSESQSGPDADQASLYSPSTTSSFPWSGEPPSPGG